MSDDQAAALLVQGTTAWFLLRRCARLASGESVVVHSAAGGVGSIAVQLARLLGAGRVVAAASTDAKRAFALELGAHAAIDAAPAEMTAAIVAANDGRRVDVVLDAVGGATFDASLAALAPFGRLVVYGIADRRQNEVRTGALLRGSHAVIGFWMAHALERPWIVGDALRELFELVAGGELRTPVGGTYPLAAAAQAHVDLARAAHHREAPDRPLGLRGAPSMGVTRRRAGGPVGGAGSPRHLGVARRGPRRGASPDLPAQHAGPPSFVRGRAGIRARRGRPNKLQQ